MYISLRVVGTLFVTVKLSCAPLTVLQLFVDLRPHYGTETGTGMCSANWDQGIHCS